MYSNVPEITNPDSRTMQINGMYQTSAIRIDDSDVSVRKTWSSDKINNALSGSARVEMKSTAEWNSTPQYIPVKGTICVYTDRKIKDGVVYPGIKIADGLAYIVDQPFVGDSETTYIVQQLEAHVNDNVRHLNEGDRARWDAKVSVDASGERLVLF